MHQYTNICFAQLKRQDEKWLHLSDQYSSIYKLTAVELQLNAIDSNPSEKSYSCGLGAEHTKAA